MLKTAKGDGVRIFSEKVKEVTYHYYDFDIDELTKGMEVEE